MFQCPRKMSFNTELFSYVCAIRRVIIPKLVHFYNFNNFPSTYDLFVYFVHESIPLGATKTNELAESMSGPIIVIVWARVYI